MRRGKSGINPDKPSSHELKLRALSTIVFCAATFWALPISVHANPALHSHAPQMSALLSQTDFEANGTHEAILTVAAFGRYAITVTSAQGTALQLVDRMAGPGEIQGTPGQSDGRIDAFLERGRYKIRLISNAGGSGKAVLSVTPFTELQPNPLQLIENKPVQAQLDDRQQLSWWIRVPTRGTYNFEAGGRYLTDLRLWENGGWIVGASLAAGESDAIPDQPLGVQHLTAQLEPGLYRLTAYGGAGLPWPGGGKDKPFLLRWGVPALSDAGRTTHTESLLGIDRFLVPGTVTELRLVMAEAGDAQITAQPYSLATMFQTNTDNTATITKTSRDPMAELPLAAQDTTVPWLVTVNDRPGGRYRLEALNASGNAIQINPSADATTPYPALLAVTLPGNPDDEIDPGFLLVDGKRHVVASDVIDLDTALPWRRHFNLLGQDETFLTTSKNVDLRVDGSGAKAQFIVRRIITDSPANAVVPAPQPSGGIWKLTPGYYVLAARPLPNGRGVMTLSLYADGGKPAVTDSPRLPAAVFPSINIDSQLPDTLINSLDPSKAFGLRQVVLPAALERSLSLELAAGAPVQFPITVREASQLDVTNEAGSRLPFTLDGKAATRLADLVGGQYQLGFAGPGPANQILTVTLTPERLPQSTPLPAMPDAAMSQPVLPPLLPGQPDFINLARNQTIDFALPVNQDALYGFETTGLLETGGAIRTRTNPSLAQAEGNGVGRNFLLQPYLREGDYQLAVQAQGMTTGHAGVTVMQTPLRDEGLLNPDLPARMTLEPGSAALYHFHVSSFGTWHILTLGLGQAFAMRLEDADGWPLIAPGGGADVTLNFAPGDYRMILLPGTVKNRAVTLLQPVLPPVTYSGHGPFAVAFGQAMANRWMEPAPGQRRRPDVWNFSLPALATVSLAIDKTMRAQVFAQGTATPLGSSNAGNWSGQLPAGNYQIEASSAKPDNRLDYTLNVSLLELVPGQSRMVTAPASLAVSLAGSPQYEISSFGDQDVQAALYDAKGHLVAHNDDRANDWNFLIAGGFVPGAYRLRVDPVGRGRATTTVSISAPVTADGPALQPGVTAELTDGLVHLMPIPALPAGALLLAGATAPVPVGLTLEIQARDGAWQSLVSTNAINPYLAMPSGADGQHYRLRAWPADHGNTPIGITIASVTPPQAGQIALNGKVTLQPIGLGVRQLAIARAAISSPALFQLTRPDDTLQWSTTANTAVAHDLSGTIAAGGDFVWLVDGSPHSLTLTRPDLAQGPVGLTLAAGQNLTLPLQNGLPQNGVGLWQASGQGAQPGIAIMDGSNTGIQAMALGGKAGVVATSFAVETGGMAQPALHLWQAAPDAGALPLTVKYTAFAVPGTMALLTGRNDVALAPGAAAQADMPPGWKRLTLNLPAKVVAVFLSGAEPQTGSVGNGTIPDVLESDATRLLLINPTKTAAPLNVVLQPEDKPGLTLAPGGLFTQFSPTPAILHVALAGPGAGMHIAGSATGIAVLGSDGDVTVGDAAQGGSGGVASLTTQPGLAILSSDIAGPLDQDAQQVSGPGSLRLDGRDRLVTLMPGPARLVSFTTDTAVLLRNETTGIPQLCAAGAALNIFQPEGMPLSLDIRPAGSGSLSGEAAFAMQAPVRITDGLGPAYFVGPGQSRLFTFSLKTTHIIGVGVRGSVDDASIRLLGAGGEDLGSGVVHMRRLTPGIYYMVVDVPQNAAATLIQPALVGLTLPDAGPPPDVQNSYRALAAPPQN
jgi:hypothetical protein